MALLSKAELLGTIKLKSETVSIGGGEVIVSEVGAEDYLKIWTDPANQTNGEVDLIKVTPVLVAYSIVDADGNRMFTDDEIELFRRSSFEQFQKLAQVAKKLNGLTGEETKNSEAGQTNCSSTDSACNSDSVIPTSSSADSQPHSSKAGKHTQR